MISTGPVKRRKRELARLIILGIVLAVLAATGWWRLTRPFSPRPATVFEVLLPMPVAVAPGVYILGKTSPSPAYLVETSQGLVLIDSGLEASATTVTDQITKLGFDVKQLRAILLTHVHADHSLGARGLRERTGAKVYAGGGDCQALREGGPREAFFSIADMPGVEAHATTVDVELAGDETIAFAETRFVVIPTPGHTPGSVCYLLQRDDLRVLFTGDIVQSLDPAIPGALGTQTAYLPPIYGGNASDYLASLRRLRALPLPDLVLPGHPQLEGDPQTPRLSQERWQALLDHGIIEMERLLARYQTDGANFLDGTPKELLPGLHYLGNLGGAAVYCLRTPKWLFLFDAPGGAQLVDFLKQRFKELGWDGRNLTAVILTSADEEATAGLAALVEHTGCKVVAPSAGLAEVRRRCPAEIQVLSENELSKSGWFDVRTLSLSGRGRAPTAYQLGWAGKTVLLSGRIPVKLSAATAEVLLRKIREPGGNADQYAESLDRLARVNPNLWLPAVPVHGQNANLYDRDWGKVLEQNGRIMQMVRSSALAPAADR